jgi:ATP-dependent exoDNAse (exonuclease V) beta subunit
LEDAEIFFCELERLEEAGELADLGDLARSLDKLFALPDVEARPEAVEIMTIHKAKGLEFDTWVVDYKTSEHEGAGIEVFLDLQRERYEAQLDGYAEAIGGARRGLYFPLGHIAEAKTLRCTLGAYCLEVGARS